MWWMGGSARDLLEGESQMMDIASRWGGIKPSGRHGVLMVTAVFCCKLSAIDGKIFAEVYRELR